MHSGRFRTFAISLGCAALSFSTAALADTHPKASSPPNILLIVADDLGYSDLGAFGSEIATPNLDSLALRGARLSHFYTAPACSPTRAMLLTGRDNHEVGFGTMTEVATADQRDADGYEGYLPANVPTLAERLRGGGYTTLMAGKWHLGAGRGHQPADRGFERSFALLQGAHNHFGADQSPAYQAARAAPTYMLDGKPAAFPVGAYSSDFFADRLIGFLGDAPRDRPFFAYLAFTSPHWPLQAPKDAIARYHGLYDDGPAALRQRRLKRMEAMGVVAPGVTPHPVDEGWWSTLSSGQRAIEARKMEVYAAMVETMDHNVGRVLATLRAQGRLDNTLVIFMSDNGPEGLVFDRPINPADPTKPIDAPLDNSLDNLGAGDSYFSYGPAWAQAASAPYWGTKEQTSEGGIHSPAIVAGPGVRPGQVIDAVAHVTDIVPTMLDYAHAGAGAADLAGRDWSDLLAGRVEAVRGDSDPLFWELFYRAAVRRGDMKAIYQPNRLPILGKITKPGEARWQLYDVVRDPGETTDLAGQSPALLKDMIGSWRDYAKRVGVVLLPEDRDAR